MNTNRLQHLVPASVILVLALVVTWLSFTEEPAESFLFPRAISVFFITLAAWNFFRAASGLARVGAGLPFETVRNITPGLLVMIVYAFWAAKGLGFYVASTLAFFILFSLYDPVPWGSLRDWIKRAVITLAFMLVIYALFALLLQVRMPRGLFF